MNTDTLRNLLGNDDALVARFVGIFKSQTPEQLNELAQFLDEQDWENASVVAHTIKSQCRYFGLEEEADWCQSIEDAPDAPSTMEKFLALKQRLDAAIAVL